MTDWVEYRYDSGENYDLDPTKYENQVRQTGRFTASVWALHLNIPTYLVPFTLTVITRPEFNLTHEFSTGGSWADWSQPAAYSGDNHLVVYFRSGVIAARIIGRRLAAAAYGYGGQEYAISTAGDYRELITDTRRKGGSDASAAEAEGESGEQADD